MKAGSGQKFASDSLLLKETIKAIREGFAVCRALGFNPQKEKTNRLYYLPFFIAIRIAKKVYSNEALCLMFDGHIQHSPDEMKRMFDDIIENGKRLNIKTPVLKEMEENIFD